MNINNKFEIGQIVYLKTDDEQFSRIVTGFTVREQSLLYGLSQGTNETFHYDFEITTEKDILATLNL